MSDAAADSDPDHEVDEKFRSLMEGLRTSLPAVQVLFAFLLIAPFQQRFNRLDALERNTFSVAFLSAGLSSVLLIAPSIHQRVRAPMTGLRRHSDHHLRVTIRVALAGSAFMAIAILATIFLVASIVYSTVPAAIVTATVGVVLLGTWLYLPLVAFRRSD
ncbi:DUF6328 family protein [Candidatus Neomicrothrix sp.]|uniref:DUF6328 family protein n=1 Tax=Candidatus Neomicrothrix sp. TaxID=2719034 RepID=UPI002595A2DF|nr:DUF6328 family protein [Candidatus Microthrix sp.]HMS48445.1 DUF6328 family protein [Candidatus Microthrix sp.]